MNQSDGVLNSFDNKSDNHSLSRTKGESEFQKRTYASYAVYKHCNKFAVGEQRMYMCPSVKTLLLQLYHNSGKQIDIE